MGLEEIVAALLAAGADPNLVGQFGDRPLTSAFRHPRILRMLIRGGADVNQRPAKQESALGRVSRLMREPSPETETYRHAAQILRAAGATEDGRRPHPLSEAAARGDVAAFDRELARAGDEEKSRALVAAATTGQTDFARRLLNLGVSPDARAGDWTAAEAALDANDGPMRELLLERGATVATTDPEELGRHLIDATRRGDLAAVKMLLDAGADINFRGSHQYMKPPLFVAVEHDHAEIVRFLIRAGADVNRREKFFYTHQTPLMAAALEGSVNAARVLIDSGANVHYADERQTTALSIAEGQREVNYLKREPAFSRIAAMLRKAGAR
jgi:ankyrin repeat protein